MGISFYGVTHLEARALAIVTSPGSYGVAHTGAEPYGGTVQEGSMWGGPTWGGPRWGEISGKVPLRNP